jgi:hypothetical protein
MQPKAKTPPSLFPLLIHHRIIHVQAQYLFNLGKYSLHLQLPTNPYKTNEYNFFIIFSLILPC